MRKLFVLATCAVALGTLYVPAAAAVPDAFGSTQIIEPNGFPGVCNQPCYTVTKTYEVYSATNPDNPLPLAGNNTYVYTLTHDGGSAGSAFVPALTQFEMAVDDTQVTAVGAIAGPGVAPSASTLSPGLVAWSFATPIAAGQTSQQLFVHSPLEPGTVNDNTVSVDAQAALDAPGTCVGPLNPPVQACDLVVDKLGCVQQPPEPGGDDCDGKATQIVLQYTGLGCDATSHLQDPKKVKCIGGAAGADPVDILVFSKKHRRHHWKKKKKKRLLASATGVSVGDTITIDAAAVNRRKLPSNVFVKIRTAAGDTVELDKFHASCSQPLGVGNNFGSLLVTSLTSTGGGTVVLEDDPFEECSTEIDIAEAPHCVGKIETLQLRYTGGDCSETVTSQSAGSVACVDAAPATANPVRIIVSETASASSTPYIDISPVNAGDIIDVMASGAGLLQFKGTTGYWIKDAVTGQILQDGYFHTSCSEPLNLGDQIGGLQVFGLDTTLGGTVSLGANVDYTYTVTNPNAGDAVNVSVDDDKLGNIVSGATVLAGQSSVFTQTAFITQETTNVATVTGEVGGVQCSAGEDQATITVNEPPEPGAICTTGAQAMRLRYTGPDLYGATVEVKAANFVSEPVVYTGVDLIGGVTELAMPTENGFTIDADAHGQLSLGSSVWVTINGTDMEDLDTTCCTQRPFQANTAAPLAGNGGAGDPSPTWFVVDFVQKD